MCKTIMAEYSNKTGTWWGYVSQLKRWMEFESREAYIEYVENLDMEAED